MRISVIYAEICCARFSPRMVNAVQLTVEQRLQQLEQRLNISEKKRRKPKAVQQMQKKNWLTYRNKMKSPLNRLRPSVKSRK